MTKLEVIHFSSKESILLSQKGAPSLFAHLNGALLKEQD